MIRRRKTQNRKSDVADKLPTRVPRTKTEVVDNSYIVSAVSGRV